MGWKEAQWRACRENLKHGLPLRPKERLEVFKRFIKAGQHKKAGGGIKSCHEIAAELGGWMSKSTIHNCLRRYFPDIATDLELPPEMHPEGGQIPARPRGSPPEEAIKALGDAVERAMEDLGWSYREALAGFLREKANALSKLDDAINGRQDQSGQDQEVSRAKSGPPG